MEKYIRDCPKCFSVLDVEYTLNELERKLYTTVGCMSCREIRSDGMALSLNSDFVESLLLMEELARHDLRNNIEKLEKKQ